MEDLKDRPEMGAPGEIQMLPFINEAHAAGRITNAVRVKDYGTGARRAQFSIAVPRRGGRSGGPQVDYFNVIAWGEVAAHCGELSKGDAVEVIGRIRTWQDETKRAHWAITAEVLKVLSRGARNAVVVEGAEELISA